MKSLKKTDALPRIITDSGTQGWIALDLGNIVLHLFLQAQRDHFDLEMLWTVGAVFDDLCNTKDSDIIQLLNMIK
jgi:ribosomal silencing factor RsfS